MWILAKQGNGHQPSSRLIVTSDNGTGFNDPLYEGGGTEAGWGLSQLITSNTETGV